MSGTTATEFEKDPCGTASRIRLDKDEIVLTCCEGSVAESRRQETVPESDEKVDSFPVEKGKQEKEEGRWQVWTAPIKTFLCGEGSFVFPFRVATSLTLASLFTVLFPADDAYPYGSFVMTTAGTLSWVPELDFATAVKKCFQRTIGTVLACTFGLGLGYISVPLGPGSVAQGAYLGIIVLVTGFLFPYWAHRNSYTSNYAAILGSITFDIVLLSVYGQEKSVAWELGFYRAVNIIIGGFVGLFTALVLWPMTTQRLLMVKVEKQMQAAGKLAHLVLEKAHCTLSGKNALTVAQIDQNATDEASQFFLKCLAGWKSCRDVFSMLKYDPFFRIRSAQEQERFKANMAGRLERTFRIERTVMLMNPVFQMDLAGIIEPDDESLAVLKSIGLRIKLVMDLSAPEEERSLAVKVLTDKDLVHVRNQVKSTRDGRLDVASLPVQLKPLHQDMPEMSLEGPYLLSFLHQLVEMLIIRAVWLHSFCSDSNNDDDDNNNNDDDNDDDDNNNDDDHFGSADEPQNSRNIPN